MTDPVRSRGPRRTGFVVGQMSHVETAGVERPCRLVLPPPLVVGDALIGEPSRDGGQDLVRLDVPAAALHGAVRVVHGQRHQGRWAGPLWVVLLRGLAPRDPGEGAEPLPGTVGDAVPLRWFAPRHRVAGGMDAALNGGRVAACDTGDVVDERDSVDGPVDPHLGGEGHDWGPSQATSSVTPVAGLRTRTRRMPSAPTVLKSLWASAHLRFRVWVTP